MSDPVASEAALSAVLDRALELGGPLLVAAESEGRPAPLALLVGSLGGPESGAIAIEAVREGFLCHHDRSRLLELEDPDLALLVGDLLYAIGLRELALAGDPGPVSILADLIRLVSERVGTDLESTVPALWTGQAIALAVGTDERHRAALEAIETGEDPGAEGLSQWSREVAGGHGAGEALSEAVQALQ